MDWRPFRVCPADQKPPAPRGIGAPEGVADRLRTAAFAELQAREAFRWAASAFPDAPSGLREEWLAMADAEDRHLGLILARLAALGASPEDRPVSDALWRSLAASRDAREFSRLMLRAEERGREAELRFQTALALSDPESAAMFAGIAADEAAHIAVPARWYPELC